MKRPVALTSAGLLALTAYYNPLGGERRRRNYRTFRRLLGVPLVTVEWAPDGRFELGPEDAELLIQVEGGDLLWQKERLLNIGLAHLRRERLARDVAVIDADVVFASEGWVRNVRQALEANPIVQCFEQVDYLPESMPHAPSLADLLRLRPEHSARSRACVIGQGETAVDGDQHTSRGWIGPRKPGRGQPGMAFAVRLPDYPSFELYEGNIVGGADSVLLAACAGVLQRFHRERGYSPGHQADIDRWAQRHIRAAAGIGWADNRVLHLWHGPIASRQYAQRVDILASRKYDPARDLDRTGAAIRLRGHAADLRHAVAQYLRSRDDA
jgi:hypothetical protein